jgi:hypothetical protein
LLVITQEIIKFIAIRCFLVAAISVVGLSIVSAATPDGNITNRMTDVQSGPLVLDYLKNITGKFTVAGINDREPNSRPTLQTDRLFNLTGRYPALWSGDFLFQADDISNRWTMIHECKRQWDHGCIVQLMLHVAPPTLPEACAWDGGVLSHLSDAQWKDLVTDGGTLNKVWKSRLDGYAVYLQ